MQEERRAPLQKHTVTVEDRRNLTITGITDIDSFDEQLVAVFTDAGELLVRGSSLHINRIDIESGEIALEGDIMSLEYTDNISQKSSLWERIFR